VTSHTADIHSSSAKAESNHPATGSPESKSFSKPTILISESEPEILAYLTRNFKQYGFEVEAAVTSEDCKNVFMKKKDSIDVVLINGSIAGDDGIAVILAIRRAKKDQRVLVVVEEENTRAKALRLGADVVVIKPIAADLILERIRHLMVAPDSFLERRAWRHKLMQI
jgi:DNA-binding response OmpR family regulator